MRFALFVALTACGFKLLMAPVYGVEPAAQPQDFRETPNPFQILGHQWSDTDFNNSIARLRLAEGALLESYNVPVEGLKKESDPWWARF